MYKTDTNNFCAADFFFVLQKLCLFVKFIAKLYP